MENFRKESKRTGKSVGQLAKEAGLTEKQFKALTRAERIATAQSRAMAREVRRLERRLKSLRRSHINFRNILLSVAGAGGLGLAIRNLTQYSSQLSETADSLGLLPSQLDRTRRAFGSFGLDILQTDRLLSNVTAKMAEARRGSARLQDAFNTLGGSLDVSDPLEQLLLIAKTFPSVSQGDRLEALRLAAGERFAIPIGGLLATPGQLEAELERIAEKFKAFDDIAVRINKNLDQTFYDLFGVLRIHFQNVVADNAEAISSFVQALEDAIPAVANFTNVVVQGTLGNRATIGGGIGGALLGAGIGGSIGKTGSLLGLLKAFTSPVGIGLLAGGGLLAIIGQFIDRAREAEIRADRLLRVDLILREVFSGAAIDPLQSVNYSQDLRKELQGIEKELQNFERILIDNTLPPDLFFDDQLVTSMQQVADIYTELVSEARDYEKAIGVLTGELQTQEAVTARITTFKNNLISVLRKETEELDESTLSWRQYGQELASQTITRDIASINSELVKLTAFNNASGSQLVNLASQSFQLELQNLKKSNREITLRNENLQSYLNIYGTYLLQQERETRQQERLTQQARLRALIEQNRLSRAIVEVGGPSLPDTRDLFGFEQSFREHRRRFFDSLQGVTTKINPDTDAALIRARTIAEASKEAREALEKLSEVSVNSATLFGTAMDRALSGVSTALTDIIFVLGRGENVFENFTKSLLNVSRKILELFINAGLVNIGNRFNLPGFQSGGVAPTGFARVHQDEIINFRTPTRIYRRDYFDDLASGASKGVTNVWNIESVDGAGVRAAIENSMDIIEQGVEQRLINKMFYNTQLRKAIRQA